MAASNQQEPAEGRKVPMLRSQQSLIHDEFDSLRGRFEAEMRQMEEEMARFKSQMSAQFSSSSSASSSSQRSVASSKTTSSTTTTTSRISSSRTSARSGVSTGDHFEPLQPDGVAEPMAAAAAATVAPHVAQMQAPPGGAASGEREQAAPATNWMDNFVNSPLIVDAAEPPGGGSSAGKLLKLRFDVSAYEPEQIVVKTLDNRLQVHAEREQLGDNRSLFSEYDREFLLPAGVDPQAITSSLSADGVLTVEAPLPARP